MSGEPVLFQGISFALSSADGTPSTSLDVIGSVERDWRMRTAMVEKNNTFMDAKKVHTDQTQEGGDFVDLTKWAILTRRIEPSGRVVTVVSGHSRSVQGVMETLTSEEKIEQVLRAFRKGEVPRQFQALFKVEMDKHRGELKIKKTTVAKVLAIKMSKERK